MLFGVFWQKKWQWIRKCLCPGNTPPVATNGKKPILLLIFSEQNYYLHYYYLVSEMPILLLLFSEQKFTSELLFGIVLLRRLRVQGASWRQSYL